MCRCAEVEIWHLSTPLGCPIEDIYEQQVGECTILCDILCLTSHFSNMFLTSLIYCKIYLQVQ
jgi:hypothetical protein